MLSGEDLSLVKVNKLIEKQLSDSENKLTPQQIMNHVFGKSLSKMIVHSAAGPDSSPTKGTSPSKPGCPSRARKELTDLSTPSG